MFNEIRFALKKCKKLGIKEVKMKALLDTNIVIHRETSHIVNQDIGTLFRWLDRTKCEKFIHCVCGSVGVRNMYETHDKIPRR